MYIKDAEKLVGWYEGLFERNEIEGTVKLSQDYIAFQREHTVEITVGMITDRLFHTLNETRTAYRASVQIYGDVGGLIVKIY